MRNSNGCIENILWTIWTIIFLVVFFVSLTLLRPPAARITAEIFCQSGTVATETSSKKTTCIDKKTGQKIDVSVMQIFGFCPAVLILIGFIFISVIANIIIKKSKASAINRR